MNKLCALSATFASNEVLEKRQVVLFEPYPMPCVGEVKPRRQTQDLVEAKNLSPTFHYMERALAHGAGRKPALIAH